MRGPPIYSLRVPASSSGRWGGIYTLGFPASWVHHRNDYKPKSHRVIGWGFGPTRERKDYKGPAPSSVLRRRGENRNVYRVSAPMSVIWLGGTKVRVTLAKRKDYKPTAPTGLVQFLH